MKLCFTMLKNYYRQFIIFGICGYGLYLRAIWRASSKLWHDEKWQILYMHLPFFDFIKSMPQVEHSGYIALDYYLIYPFFKLFGDNKWGLAIPHILLTAVGFYLLYRVCKLYYKTIWGYIIAFSVVCLNKNLVIHSFEIRTYAILPTLALGAFLLSQQLISENIRMSTWKKWAIGAFYVLVIWSFAYGIVMLAVVLLFFIFHERTNSNFGIVLKDISKFMFFVLLIAMPLWIYSMFFAHLGYHRVADTFHYISNPLINTTGFLKSVFGNLVGHKGLYFILGGFFFPFFLPYKDRFTQLGLLFVLVVIPIELLILAAMKVQYWFLQRHFIWVIPFFALYLGWVWDSFICYARDKLIK